MTKFPDLQVWFAAGSQRLYGSETLAKVQGHSERIAAALSASPHIPVSVIAKPVMNSAELIEQLCADAGRDCKCIGVIVWMHTFSPARMWIAGLRSLRKPLLHFHTQFNEELPWSAIDMDFMNLNQSAHGDREFGFLTARMRLRRKVIVGFWQDAEVQAEIGVWSRAAAAWNDAQTLRVARLGDNMRNVAVTEGNKLTAQMTLSYTVNGYGLGEVAQKLNLVADEEVNRLAAEYDESYVVEKSLRPDGSRRPSLLEAAKIELALRAFLKEVGARAFTDTFEDLHGLPQLPGIAVQRLMADGFGFGAEGDWKTAALVRAAKVMSAGLTGGASFMEDYTYHLQDGGQVLGAHMLEICPSIADERPSLEIHPLSIGGKADPVRLLFTAAAGDAVNVCLVDVGNRFRLIINEVNILTTENPVPKLPVARAVWKPQPNLKVAAKAWLYAGGSHHTVLSRALTIQHFRDFADIAGIECLVIDSETNFPSFTDALNWNDIYYHLIHGPV